MRELVAQHVAHRAQLAVPAEAAAQQVGEAVAAAVAEAGEIDGDQRKPIEPTDQPLRIIIRPQPHRMLLQERACSRIIRLRCLRETLFASKLAPTGFTAQPRIERKDQLAARKCLR
ncbi:hypothetical protein D9M68_831920 [compost metagenome]